MDKNISLTLRDKLGKTFDFETLKQLQHFVKSELTFWRAHQVAHANAQGQLGTFLSAANYFQQIEDLVSGWKVSLDSWDENTLQANIDQHISRQLAGQLAGHWLWKGYPFIEPWFSVADKFGFNAAESFIESFSNNGQLTNLNTKDRLKGALLAYEFDLQDETTLTRRRNAEKKSIAKVRADLISAKDLLFKDVADFQSEFHEWGESYRNQSERLYEVHKKLGKRQSLRQDKHFNELHEAWSRKITDLEETYREKLRLEAPATYWQGKAENNFWQGIVWTILLVLVLVSGLAGFGYLFKLWVESKALPVQLHSLQGIALFITILSSYAFMIKTFARLAFSAFHLQRDAEEREQLTHVYLALSHDGEIDSEAKNIVLQALFSRADTGLLSGDSSPTMPGLHELVKATSSK